MLFFSERRTARAVCVSGRWAQDGAASAVDPACPEYVFAGGEIWNDGSYLPNTCDQTSAPTCRNTYFYRLPEGGTGHRTATCVAGRWQPEPDPLGDEPFRLRRVLTSSELAAYLKQGLEAIYGGTFPYAYSPWGTVGGPSGEPSAPGGGPGLSQTNVQEAGVDEEDRIKSDGDTLYILKNHQSLQRPPPGGRSGNRVRIVDIDPLLPAAAAIGELEVATGANQTARGMYLRAEADQLIVTASGLGLDWFYWYSPLAWQERGTSVASIDVGDPQHPAQNALLELDGELISSRRIGNVLYLATRFFPYLPGLDFYDPSRPGSAEEVALIEQASISQLMPSYRSSAHPVARPLVDPRDCYLPTADARVKTADLVTLVAIDLDTMELRASRCFAGPTETIYVSLDSIYLASTRYDYTLTLDQGGFPVLDYPQPEVETDLHKFSLAGGAISYQASGSVDGHLGWLIDRKPFRLSERGDDLRVITYTDELTPDRSPVAVTVLRDTGDDELRVLSRLPNQQRPGPIGKPGEELYATRFVGDRAYLVTFQVTDPLYVIDLSRPEDPLVAGELEIAGYSDYLHPFGDRHLLGVGKDAIPADFGAGLRGAWYQGVKVALYDVSDPAHPFEADAVVLGKRGSEAPVLQNHRALTFLPATETTRARVAIGTAVHQRPESDQPPEPWTHYGWSYSGLHLFEVDTAAGKILQQGRLRVEEYGRNGRYPIRGDDRSLLAGEAVFYVHGDDVFTSRWSEPGSFAGPE